MLSVAKAPSNAARRTAGGVAPLFGGIAPRKGVPLNVARRQPTHAVALRFDGWGSAAKHAGFRASTACWRRSFTHVALTRAVTP